MYKTITIFGIFIVYSTRFSFAFVFISITLKILCTTLDYYKQNIQIHYVTVYFSVNVCIHFYELYFFF